MQTYLRHDYDGRFIMALADTYNDDFADAAFIDLWPLWCGGEEL